MFKKLVITSLAVFTISTGAASASSVVNSKPTFTEPTTPVFTASNPVEQSQMSTFANIKNEGGGGSVGGGIIVGGLITATSKTLGSFIAKSAGKTKKIVVHYEPDAKYKVHLQLDGTKTKYYVNQSGLTSKSADSKVLSHILNKDGRSLAKQNSKSYDLIRKGIKLYHGE